MAAVRSSFGILISGSLNFLLTDIFQDEYWPLVERKGPLDYKALSSDAVSMAGTQLQSTAEKPKIADVKISKWVRQQLFQILQLPVLPKPVFDPDNIDTGLLALANEF